MARRANLSEVQVLGGLADERLVRIIRCALEEARAKGRGELTQTQATIEAVLLSGVKRTFWNNPHNVRL